MANENTTPPQVERAQPKQKPRGKSKKLPPFNVVLLDDNDHSYEYVIEMLRVLFGHDEQLGYRLATRVDTQGRAVVMTTHRELAELKRDQIHSYGADQYVASSKGSMSAFIEPAE